MNLDVYVSELSGFDLDDDTNYNIGHTPKRISPLFPFGSSGLFSHVVGEIKAHRIPGRQVDWGAWVAFMSGRQIVELVDWWYGKLRLDLPHLVRQLDELRSILRQLDEHRVYGLVCAEL